jgi:DNA invertase Pin-like site-specific DNA recombinase
MEHISDGAEGIILESMLEGFAEYFSANLSENVKRGMDANAAQFLCVGGNRTLGYKIVDKKYVIDPETAPIIKRIFEMYIMKISPPEILQYLKDQGIKSVHGKDFRQNNVYYILKNKRYAGYYTYKGTETKDGIPAIISEEFFNQVQEMMKKTKKAPARTKAVDEKYLLSG